MPKKVRIAIVIDLDWPVKRHQAVFAGTQSYARQRGWQCTIWPYPPPLLTPRGKPAYNGIIGRVTPALARAARAAGIPLVNVWYSSPVRDVPLVSSDIRIAGRWAGNHLRARGFNRFAFLGLRRARASRECEEGFREAIGAAPGQYARLLVSPNFSDSPRQWRAFHSALTAWVRSLTPPVGLFADGDSVSRYAANAAAEAEMRVPQDVAIVSPHNEIAICLAPEPSLTSIELGFDRVGYRAAQLLNTLMLGRKPPQEPILLPPVELVARASTDAFAVSDPIVAKALRFIADQSHRPLKVRDVVAQVPASWRTLERRFAKLRGHSISEEILRMRMERVKRLLIESEQPLKKTATACGFANAKRLCETFRRLEGMTPGEYRRQAEGR